MADESYTPDIRKIKADVDGRIETGALQIGDDWPGLFVRGDDCVRLRHVLFLAMKEKFLSSSDDWFLTGLIAAIDFDVTQR